jgi:hypothetical protein
MDVMGDPFRPLHHRNELLQDLMASVFYFNELCNHFGVVGIIAEGIFEFGMRMGKVVESRFELLELRLLAHGQGFPAKRFHDVEIRGRLRADRP